MAFQETKTLKYYGSCILHLHVGVGQVTMHIYEDANYGITPEWPAARSKEKIQFKLQIILTVNILNIVKFIPNSKNAMKFIFHTSNHVFVEVIRKRQFVLLYIMKAK